MKGMEELSSMFSSRMAEFEKNMPRPGAAPSNITMKGLATEYATFKSFVWSAFKVLKAQADLLYSGLDRLETHSRRKVLLFHGVTEDADEDVPKKICNVLSNQMRLTSVGPAAFEVCHRIGSKKESARPILVRFNSMTERSLVWKTKTALKGSKISISEFLTKARQDTFVAARKHFGMGKCWTADGVIVIVLPDKTRKKIVAMSELKILMSQQPKIS